MMIISFNINRTQQFHLIYIKQAQYNWMQHSFPAKLEIVSMQLADKSDDNFMCSISLMKGMQNFGQIKFQIEKDYTQYTFSDQKIISFFYVPRLTTRRDAFFKIILTDLQSKQQMGEIPISTHFLVQNFTKNPTAVIQQKKQFFQGVSLNYKIFQPILEMQTKEPTIGFEKSHIDTKSSGFFARVEPEKMIDSKVHRSNKVDKQQLKKSQKLMQIPLISILSPQVKAQQKGELKPASKVPFLATLLKKQPINTQNQAQSQLQVDPLKLSLDLHSSILVNQMFGLVRHHSYEEQKKKHSLSSQSNQHHHGPTTLSKKLKVVIFMLIFGFLLTIFDVYQDKQQERILKKAKKLKTLKKTKSSQH